MKPRTDSQSGETSKAPTISSSYLVRVWQESGGEAARRFYLRDLKTGEERYLADPGQIGEFLIRGLHTRKPGRARREETA